MSDKQTGTVYFEIMAIGHSVKVVAVDAATGTEVVTIAPASLPQEHMKRLALRKLQRRLEAGA